MVLRKALLVIAFVLILVGISQIALASAWLPWIRSIVGASWFYLWGLAGILLGVILLLAVMERVVGLRAFLALLALYSAAWGVVLLASPESVRGLIYALVIERPGSIQIAVVALGGVIRVILGIVLLYALSGRARRDRPSDSPAPPQPPLEQSGL